MLAKGVLRCFTSAEEIQGRCKAKDTNNKGGEASTGQEKKYKKEIGSKRDKTMSPFLGRRESLNVLSRDAVVDQLVALAV